jgi:teichuronic acid biosynthesis glycosyltransferase TuaC
VRVLTVTNMYPYSGSPYYGVFVRDHVAALRAEGAEVDVLFTNPHLGRIRYATEVARLIGMLRRRRYDVVDAHHTYCVFQAVFARAAARARMPIVFTSHEGEVHLPHEGERSADVLGRLVYSHRLKRHAFSLADAIVAVEERLPRAAGFRGDYVVVPPAVDTVVFRPVERSRARRTLDLEDGPIVLFPADPARLHKGASLLEAALELLDRRPHVIHGGTIDRNAMPLYMNAADVVALPSRFEASPMAAKEALACDTPLVATDVGDVRRLFKGVPGFYCVEPSPQAVARGLERALAHRGAVGGRDRVLALGLTPSAVACRYLEVFQVAASSSDRQSAPRSRRAGTPATVANGSTSLVTTAPAPTTALAPISTPPRTVTPEPIDAPRRTTTGNSSQSSSV